MYLLYLRREEHAHTVAAKSLDAPLKYVVF